MPTEPQKKAPTKMQKRAQKRKQRYDNMMNDARISSTWKHSSNPPGSNKKS